jgi:hypothetical protein
MRLIRVGAMLGAAAAIPERWATPVLEVPGGLSALGPFWKPTTRRS